MKIISYNVNGIRAAIKKGFADWLQSASPDVVCIQEIKANPEQVDLSVFEKLGYRHYWHPAQKKGYSGVAILSRTEPLHVEVGCGNEKYDTEGRVIRADFKDFSVVNIYMPSGSSSEIRQAFKMEWLKDFEVYIKNLSKKLPRLIISGDYNICHRSIDIHNPVANAQSPGFTPEEREWMEQFINHGFIDSFRHFNKEPHQYTWWSQRGGARARNLGWRIDYHLVSRELEKQLNRAVILTEAKHSDHCPVLLELHG